MKFLSRLFGGSAAARGPQTQSSSLPSGQSRRSTGIGASGKGSRRELLRVALRDTFQRHGIPMTWVTPELVRTSTRDGQPGIHVRLIVRHWDPRLPSHTVALQNAIITRVHLFDPVAENWLTGISWQFSPEDESNCPAMPHPGTWTMLPSAVNPARPAAPSATADVIEGPVHIVGGSAARAELERQLAGSDGDYAADQADAFAHMATQPMQLNTEPGALR